MIYYSASTGGFYDSTVNAALPGDAKEISAELHVALLAGQGAGKSIAAGPDGLPVLQDPPPATPQQVQAACVAAIQGEMDRQAQAHGYDSILSACSYAAQASGAPFQAQGAAFLAWRSTVWQEAYAKQAQVAAGTATMPTPAEAVAAMPALVLPS